MELNLVSNFAERLIHFLEQKRALGYLYKCSYDFKHFDQMCAEHFPNETKLTSEICQAWATRRGNESSKTTKRRLPFLREFARYLIQMGEDAYILPFNLVKSSQRYIPYIYSTDEIQRLWQAFDERPPGRRYLASQIILPAIVRLMYCCGLRPSEVLNLQMTDVDLEKGKLSIIDSKNHKDRIVMLADDLCDYCRDCDSKIRLLIPERRFFFAKDSIEPCKGRWLNYVFDKVKEKIQWNGNDNKTPRLYDLRHSFATHRLYQWMLEGEDLNAKLPYLSLYMGHKSLTETSRYLHFIPGMFEEMSGFHYEPTTDIFPEVVIIDE